MMENELSVSYDKKADVLYISNCGVEADDSVIRDDGIIVRYKDSQIVGVTIPNLSKRIEGE